jgi:hypothetical protein
MLLSVRITDGFFACSALVLAACLRWWALLDLVAFAALVRLCACGVGLSLISWWSISVAPVRGSTYFSLPPQRKVGKRKRLEPPAKRVPRAVAVVVHLESVLSHIPRQ